MGPTYTDLPIGMRFRPSDLEIATYFLMNKALGRHMKLALTVPEECHDIFSIHPRDLPGYDIEEEHWYFYCQKRNNQVTTTNSYNLWIPTEEETETDVLDPKNGELVGIKRSFAFIENEEESDNNDLSDEEEEASQYNWFLDEISLPLTVVDTDWTVCHIFCEKTKPEFVPLPIIESDESEEDEEEEEEDESVDKPAESLDLVKEKDETVLPPPPASP